MTQAGDMDPPADGAQARGGIPVARLRLLRRMVADPYIKFASLKVGVVLLDRYNARAGHCYPSIASLAADAQLDKRTVRRAVGRLVERGYFRVTRGGGRTHASRYWPNLEKGGRSAPVSDTERGAQESLKGGCTGARKGGAHAPRTWEGTWEGTWGPPTTRINGY